MKEKFYSELIKRTKKYWKKGLSLTLVVALLLGCLYIGNEDAAASEIPLEMPKFQDFHIMPAQIANNSSYYYQYDNADSCWYNVVSEDVIVTYSSSKLSELWFKGRGCVIAQAFTDPGNFTIGITLGPRLGWGSNPFKGYSQIGQLSSRIIHTSTFNMLYYKYMYSERPTGTLMTDWKKMYSDTNTGQVISGSSAYNMHDIMVIMADFDMPDVNQFRAETLDGVPVLWLSCGEKIRPANDSITQSMLEKMKVQVELVPKMNQSEENKVVTTFKATKLDYNNGQICFTAEEPEKLLEDEWRVLTISDVSEEQEYTLKTSAGDTDLKVNSPVTDMAGNPVVLEESLSYIGSKQLYLDVLTPKVVSSTLTGDMIKTNTSEEIFRPDMFAGVGETVSMSLTLSEKVILKSGASMDNIYMNWSVGDDIVTTKLTGITNVNLSVNTDKVSVLKFEPLTVTKGMTGAIKPKELVGAEYLMDASQNVLSPDLENALPDRQIGVDAQGPTISMGERMDVTNDDLEKYFIYPITIEDGENASGSGVISSTYIPVEQLFSLSSNRAVEGIEWQFVVSNVATEQTFAEKGTAVSTEKQYGSFMLPENTGTYYLHLYMKSGEGKEISNTTNFHLDFQLADAKGNTSSVTALTLTGCFFDDKAPVLEVAPQAVTVERVENSSDNKVTFSAKITSSDLNEIKELQYKWIPEGDNASTAEWLDVPENGLVSYAKEGSGTIAMQLYVRATDNSDNSVNYVSEVGTFTADISRTTASFDIIYDADKVGGVSDVSIRAPKKTDGTEGGYTRVILTIGTETYVRVFDHTTDKTALSLLDPTANDWYLVTIDGTGTYTAVETMVPAWDSYYGTIQVGIAASSNSLVPSVGNTVIPEAGVDTTYQESKGFSFTYTCARNDVHDITFTGAKASDGTELTSTGTYNNYNIYKIMLSPAGARFGFSIANTLFADLGSRDVDFTNSYAVWYKTDANGAAADEISGRIPLAAASEQYITVPYQETSYESAAYLLTIHLAQKSGGTQEFTLPAYLLVDNDALPNRFGVTEYVGSVALGAADNNNSRVNAPIEKIAEEGSVLSALDIGIAEATDVFQNEIEIIEIDGKPAFLKGTTNALGLYDTVKVLLHADTTGTTVLGQTLGNVQGIRYWNQASAGDPADIEWNPATNGELRLDLNLGLTSIDSIIVDKETLASTNVSDFRASVGHNVICYQLILGNGRISPVYTFDLNLYDKAPEVELSYVFGDSFTRKDIVHGDYQGEVLYGTDYDRLYANSVSINIDSASSENGELTVYRATCDTTLTNSYDCWSNEEITDTTNPIPILADSIDGYQGYAGTGKNNRSITEYYIFMDETGNAVYYYPIVASPYMDSVGQTKVNGYSPDYVKDENGNNIQSEYGPDYAYPAEDYSPTIYYITKDTRVGTLAVQNDTTADSDCYVLEIYMTDEEGYTSWTADEAVEQISVQIDNRQEVMLKSLESHVPGVNQAGIVYFDNQGWIAYLGLVFPYDVDKAEGEEITHTITVRGYINGEIATDVDGMDAIQTITITAPNTKPTVTQSTETPELGKVAVTANTYLYAEGITENDATGIFAKNFTVPVYEDSTYTNTYFDVYGAAFEIGTEITNMPVDPVITLSTTATTAESVVVTIESKEGGTFALDAECVLPEGATVTGAGTSKLVVTMPDNGTIEVVGTYGASMKNVTIPVTNIHNEPIVPKVEWSYNPYKVNTKDNTYVGEVTAILVDENGSPLTDLTTGITPTYTFVPGGERTYTFTKYINAVGVVGADVTVELPFTLITEVMENDTYAPDVAITGHAKLQNTTISLGGAFVKEDTSRPGYGTEDATLVLQDYAEVYGEENIYDSLDALFAKTSFAERFVFNLDIADENNTKIFIKADKNAEAPDYDSGTSDKIDGVNIVGRTLQMDKNTDFTLYIVDSKNNATSVYVTADNIRDDIPTPTITKVLTKAGNEVRVYLSNPNLEGVSNLMITGSDKIEQDITSSFYGLPYKSYTQNYPEGTTIFYSYELDGVKLEGSVIVKITELDESIPQAEKWKWSANYDGTGVKYTNQDITLQLELNKALSDAYLVDREGNQIAAPEGVTVVYLENRVTVIYEDNTEALALKVINAVNKKTNIISLPTITTIDKTSAVLSAQTNLNSNHTKASVTITADENVIWPDGSEGTEYSYQTKENGKTSVCVSDRAGNTTEITIELTEIITENLRIQISTAGSDATVIDPASYQVDIGDKLYVKTNRAATITLNNTTVINAGAEQWKEFVIAEDAEGLYPVIRAEDSYGNTALVHLLQVPIKDRTAPSIMLSKNLISLSLGASQEEIEASLRGNFIASDDVTARENLIFRYDMPNVSTAGTYNVTYYVEDEAGNITSTTGLIRFYNGEELCIELNGKKVENDETICVTAGTQNITITHDGEPYKVEWREGIKSLGQMKYNANVLTAYTDVQEQSYTIELNETGYYTFLVTTQGRVTYRFVIYVEE